MPFLTPQKNIVLIPYWIRNILERHNLSPATALNLSQLKTVTSNEDLVLTLLLNHSSRALFSVDNVGTGLENYWCGGYSTSSPASCEIVMQLEQLAPLHQTGLDARLFGAQAIDPRYPEAFDIFDVNEKTLLVTIYPGHFGGTETLTHQSALIRALLKHFYQVFPYDALAREPLFERYLALL